MMSFRNLGVVAGIGAAVVALCLSSSFGWTSDCNTKAATDDRCKDETATATIDSGLGDKLYECIGVAGPEDPVVFQYSKVDKTGSWEEINGLRYEWRVCDEIDIGSLEGKECEAADLLAKQAAADLECTSKCAPYPWKRCVEDPDFDGPYRSSQDVTATSCTVNYLLPCVCP